MALDVKFSICQASNCKGITFKETTGAYDAGSNTTGWGAPNEILGNATVATLTLKGPDGTTYAPIDLLTLDSFPKDDPTAGYLILASAVDSSLTDYADGNWEITYTVVAGGKTYDETITFFFHCKVDSCICKKIAALKVGDCECDPDTINEVLKMKAYSYSMEYAAGCGNLTQANEILATLQKMCGC